jgi:NTE family protein
VSITGGTAAEDTHLSKSLTNRIGKPIDTASLEKQLSGLNAQGSLESLRYGIVEDHSGNDGLGISVVPKANEPPSLDFGITVDGSDPNDVRFGLSGRFTAVNVGGYRSEWRTDVSIGNIYGISSEYFHPFTGDSNWFIAPRVSADKSRFDLYNNRNRTAEYSLHRAALGLDVGYVIGKEAEFRIGEALDARQVNLKIGTPLVADYSRASGDTSAQFRYFGQDSSVVPHRGLNSETRVDWFSASPFGGSYHSAETRSNLFVPVSEKGSIWFAAEGASAFGAKNLGLESFTLGGPFRLGAYGINEFVGNQYLLLQGGYAHQIVTFNPLFGGAVYGLAWFETGKMYGDPANANLAKDGSVAIVAKTGLGPIFAGVSVAASDRVKWWFGIGHVFNSNR